MLRGLFSAPQHHQDSGRQRQYSRQQGSTWKLKPSSVIKPTLKEIMRQRPRNQRSEAGTVDRSKRKLK
jgi:hypothetical protein